MGGDGAQKMVNRSAYMNHISAYQPVQRRNRTSGYGALGTLTAAVADSPGASADNRKEYIAQNGRRLSD